MLSSQEAYGFADRDSPHTHHSSDLVGGEICHSHFSVEKFLLGEMEGKQVNK